MKTKTVNLTPNENTLSGKYTADSIILVKCNAVNQAFTVTMPSAKGIQNVIFILMKTDSTANAVTINFSEDETGNGASSITLSSQYSIKRLISDLSNYFEI